MMRMPLMIASLIRHADRWHGDAEIVSRTVEGPIHRYTYKDAHARARRLARALLRLGVREGDRVGTLAWNGYRHFELYYAVSGTGAVIHTINPRLFFDQLAYIVGHAEDRYVFFDLTFAPLVEKLAARCPGVEGWVAMTDRSRLPGIAVRNLLAYEDLVEAEDDGYDWPDFDEDTASSLCYTSGTTGHPKGVLFSHRSTLLHALCTSVADVHNHTARSTVLPIVPMFHVNAWGIPYSAPLVGAKLVLPGPGLDGASLYELCETEKVDCASGVPTVWFNMIAYLKERGLKLSTLRTTTCGGAAVPAAMIRTLRDDFGIRVLHGWGMTEMSPVGTMNAPKAKHVGLSPDDELRLSTRQGRPLYGVDMKIVDAEGRELPHDGTTPGDLVVRGPFILRRYYRDEGGDPLTEDGWLPTGDVGTIDDEGYLTIVDRSKDMIKSGGEWISSIELENVAMGHPAVAEAAAIGIAHPRWNERPLLVVVKRANAELTRDALIAFFDGKVARWARPDDVVFVDELPHTATGKLSKRELRQRFRDHVLPE